MLLLAGAVSLAHGAGIYRWTDERGKVHYGDRPPARDATPMVVKPPSRAAKPGPGDAERRLKQRRLLDAYAKERQDKQTAREKSEREKQLLARRCASARKQLTESRVARYLYREGKGGKREILSSAERKAYTEKLDALVRRHCR